MTSTGSDNSDICNISIIIPVLNEAQQLEAALTDLQPFRARGHEVLVVDGGSRDGSVSIARKLADRVLMSGPGRAQQMNAGADSARHEYLLFLHADSRLPADADKHVVAALRSPAHAWGRFDIRLSGKRLVFRLIETAINWRSALSGVATGDQAIFVTRQRFEAVGSYDSLPLMEDVALSKKLLRHERPARIHAAVQSSSRKWEQGGIVRTTLLMWRLRAAYFFGVHPDQLVERYYGAGKAPEQSFGKRAEKPPEEPRR